MYLRDCDGPAGETWGCSESNANLDRRVRRDRRSASTKHIERLSNGQCWILPKRPIIYELTVIAWRSGAASGLWRDLALSRMRTDARFDILTPAVTRG